MTRSAGSHRRGLSVAPAAALLLVCAAAAAAQPRPTSASKPSAVERQQITARIGQLPIRFEPTAEKGTFLARGIGSTVRLTGTSIEFPLGTNSSREDSIRVQFLGARKSSRVTGLDMLPGRVNYLDVNNDSRSRRNVRTFARARTTSLYRGVDVEYYGAGDLLEYDFIVRAGVRPDVIRLSISGAPSVVIASNGDLVYSADQHVLLRKPVAYQTINGVLRDVEVEYLRRMDGTFGFATGEVRPQPDSGD